MGIIALLVLVSALLIGLVLIAHGSIAKNDWGVNPDPVSCPKCNAQLSYIRQPKSFRQALWGGYTCANCNCEIDKWGREIAPSKSSKRTDQQSRSYQP
jgi:hypothetical protein